jgi:hypothetical protein
MNKIEVIQNVLSESEIQFLMDDLNPKQNCSVFVESNDGAEYGYSLRKLDCTKHPVIKQILPKLNLLPDSLCAASIVYYPTNSYNPIHPDNCYVDETGAFIKTKNYEKTCVIFLNNDFAGGELVYPKQGCIFLPIIGSAVICPAGGDYPHLVSEITSGERFTLVIRIY